MIYYLSNELTNGNEGCNLLDENDGVLLKSAFSILVL